MNNCTSKWLRVIAVLLLAATLLTVVLTSCGNDSEKEQKVTKATNDTSAMDADSTTEKVKALYGDYDFNEYDFKILGIESGKWWYGGFMSDTFNEIWYETDSADPLESAVYTRNRRTEDLLNITISPVWVEDSYACTEKVRTGAETGDTDYDLALSSLADTLTVAMEGVCANLQNIDTLDLNADWWDQNAVTAYTMFNDRLYLLAGDYNIYDDMSILFFLFNKDLAEQVGLGDIYQYVKDNNWTIDTFAELSMKVYHDDGDGDITNDIYGSNQSGALFHGFNLPKTEQDEDGIPMLTIESEKHVDAALKLYNTVVEPAFSTPDQYMDCDNSAIEQKFCDGNILFLSILTLQLNRLRDTTTNFGVLPFPKLNSAQTAYSHYVNQCFFSCIFVPIYNKDLERTGIVMDTLSGFSTDTVYETEFGTLMGYDSKLLRDDDSKNMLDIVMSSRLLDFSVLDLGEMNNKLYQMNTWGSFMYSSVVDSNKRAAKAKLAQYVNKFEALE